MSLTTAKMGPKLLMGPGYRTTFRANQNRMFACPIAGCDHGEAYPEKLPQHIRTSHPAQLASITHGLNYELVSVREKNSATGIVTTTLARAYVLRIWAGHQWPPAKQPARLRPSTTVLQEKSTLMDIDETSDSTVQQDAMIEQLALLRTQTRTVMKFANHLIEHQGHNAKELLQAINDAAKGIAGPINDIAEATEDEDDEDNEDEESA